jgi:PAS domain S-box-containing protein
MHTIRLTDSAGRPAGIRGVMVDVTKRQRHFHRRLTDTELLGVLFWNLDGSITGSNDAFLHMLGYTREDALAGRIDWDRLTPKEFVERDHQAFGIVARCGKAEPYEKEFIHRNGDRISVLVGPASLDDRPGKGVSYALDITAYKKRVREQQVLADLSQRALHSELSEFFQYAKNTIREALHVERCRIVLRGRKPLADDRHEDTFAIPSASVAIVDDELQGVLEVYADAGRQFSAEQQTFLQAAANVLSGAIRHRRSTEALALKEQQLSDTLRLEALGRLAGGIAHDFNNLLTAIVGYADLASDGNPPNQEELNEIQRAAGSAAALVRQLLAFSRRQTLQTRRIDLCGTVNSVERMLRRLIGEDITLVCRTPTEPLFVTGDPAQIEQVLMNLVLNARDAIDRSGTITVAVDKTSEQGREVASLIVSDTGLGMDETTRSRIFEPFFTTKQDGKGNGLGLATVHGIVHQSGGTISVRSELGRGSEFTVSLPLEA